MYNKMFIGKSYYYHFNFIIVITIIIAIIVIFIVIIHKAFFLLWLLAGMYGEYGTSVLNKTIPGQVLPGQPKPRKPRRPWTRAVFSNLQRKGLEKRFQLQKYLTKADRHQLASMLGLSDNQVKVWFQNRRMKWRQEARETITTGSPEEGSDKQDQ